VQLPAGVGVEDRACVPGESTDHDADDDRVVRAAGDGDRRIECEIVELAAAEERARVVRRAEDRATRSPRRGVDCLDGDAEVGEGRVRGQRDAVEPTAWDTLPAVRTGRSMAQNTQPNPATQML